MKRFTYNKKTRKDRTKRLYSESGIFYVESGPTERPDVRMSFGTMGQAKKIYKLLKP